MDSPKITGRLGTLFTLGALCACTPALAAGAFQPPAAPANPPTAAGSPKTAAPAAPSANAASEPLPTDPNLVIGKLDNGLAYVIRKHANPENRSAVWIHISSGSLNESENTRGIAHYLEHMAFNGSKNFPPGTVVDYFQSIGLAFGRDQNAFTSFDQTTYQLYLPDTKPATIDRALTFMSDVAGRLLLQPEEIEKERGIIIEEKRTRASAQQRVQDQIFEKLAPGSTFGRRLPIGTEETIKGVQRPDFQAYYNRFYVASNMTVIVVADADPAPIVEMIRKQFADLPKVDRPADLPVGVKPYTESRAIVATDPELKDASLQIVRIQEPKPAARTVAEERKDLVELIGTWAFNRRIGRQLAEGRASFLSASASLQDITGALRLRGASAGGRPDKWRQMLTDLATDLRRAELHGFSDTEISDARTALIAQAEEAVSRESTVPARAVLARLNGDIARGAPLMSAQQRLDLLKRLLPSIAPAEVSAAFAANFSGPATFVLTLPTGGDVPSESDLIKLGEAALAVTPEKEAEAARAASLMTKAPAPGKVAERAVHAASAVASAWLDNGVRVHHRFMDQQKNQATISISLAGGAIEETDATRGLAEVGALAWSRQATSSLSSTQIRDLMTGKKVRVNGAAGRDTLTLTVSGNPEELETGLQLAHLLLTDPKIEQAAFDQWKQNQERQLERKKVDPRLIIGDAVASTFFPQPTEARNRPLTAEQLARITLDAAQKELLRRIKSAPIEVAVVGDIPEARAMELVAQYLGSLPSRDRVTPATFANLRKIERPKGPLINEVVVDIQTPQGIVLDGFFGPDIQNVRDVRLMQMASRLLSTRMVKTVREEKQLVYSISAASQPAAEYPGYGLFLATAPTDPSKTAALAETLEQMYSEFAKSGPTDEELATARVQFANQLAETMKEPPFWLARLSTLTYRGLNLDDTMAAPDAYQAFTAKEVQEAFGRYYLPERRFRISVKPGKPS